MKGQVQCSYYSIYIMILENKKKNCESVWIACYKSLINLIQAKQKKDQNFHGNKAKTKCLHTIDTVWQNHKKIEWQQTLVFKVSIRWSFSSKSDLNASSKCALACFSKLHCSFNSAILRKALSWLSVSMCWKNSKKDLKQNKKTSAK